MSNSTHPLPIEATPYATPPPIDHATLIAQAQASLDGTARQIKAVALDLQDQKLSAGLLRAYDDLRRRSLILGTYVADLQNDQQRQMLESGLELPPDVAPPPLFGSASADGAPVAPSASQVGAIAGQSTTAYRPGGFLQEP